MIDDEAIIKRLEGAIGADRVLVGEAARAYGADGFAPFVAVVPDDREQAAEIIRIAADSHVGVLPCGGRTKLSWEPAPTGMVVGLSTEQLSKVVQHEPRDLTVTAEAGVILDKLGAVLREHRQRLSIDPPHGDRATLGGIAAANDSGPLRYGYGTMRDLVVGMEVIGADGVATHSGGRVVKNVAGYDMHRLHIGAFGSLGLITEMSFRLHPLPEAFRLAVVHCGDGERAESCIASILSGRTRPVLLELITPQNGMGAIEALGDRAAASDAWTLVVGYEDCREAVAWQCEHLAESLSMPVEVRDEDGSAALYASVREWPGREATVAFKATMASAQVVAFHAWARDRGFGLVSHAGNGVVYGRSEDPATIEAGDDLAAVAADGGGHLTWTRLPADADVPIWQPARGDLSIMKRVKDAFDPHGVLAPGRFVDEM